MRPSNPVWGRSAFVFGAAAVLAVLAVVAAPTGASAGEDQTFVGVITDTECGPDHRPMLAKGDMGKDDHECTLACIRKGATFGFVDGSSGKFYQLDDQESPAPLAGHRVRIEGRIEGDTILVKTIVVAD